MTRMSPPTDMRREPRGTFVQTDRASHEAWARLSVQRPAASAVLHLLAASVGNGNAVVVSQKTIAKIIGVTDRTVRSAIADLEAGKWLQVVKIGAGRESAYILNDRVVWADKRDNLRMSRFSAEVIADAEDQSRPPCRARPCAACLASTLARSSCPAVLVCRPCRSRSLTVWSRRYPP